jgi:hypothetical protein
MEAAMPHSAKYTGRFVVDGGPGVSVRWWSPSLTDSPQTARTGRTHAALGPSTDTILLEPVDVSDADWIDDVIGVLDQGSRQVRGRVYRTGAVFSFLPKRAG